jgi:hypothetical protein
MSTKNQELETIFKFDVLEITASWDPEVKIDMKTIVSDLDIFEHLDKPWMTGLIAFEDTSDILSGIGLGTNDRVEVKISRTEDPIGVFCHKFFRIDKIVEKINQGLNENTQVVLLHLIEEVWYESNAINVNKSYEGKPGQIIKSISESFLTDRTVIDYNTTVQDMKVIVPNMTPLEAISWIKNRATTEKGYPLFVYSAMPVSSATDFFWCMDLEFMLNLEPWTEDAPFNNFASSQTSRGRSQRRTIKAYEHKSSEDLNPLIKQGLIGARHQFIDVTDMHVEKVDYNHETDINELLTERGMKGRGVLPSHFSVHDKKLTEMATKDKTLGNRVITTIGGTEAYKGTHTIDERDKKSSYKHKPLSAAFKTLLSYDTLVAVVDGYDFTIPNHLNTIGRVMSFLFMSTQSNPETLREQFDKQKTGNYLIYAAKHSFKSEGYDVTLTAVKLTHGEYNDS